MGRVIADERFEQRATDEREAAFLEVPRRLDPELAGLVLEQGDGLFGGL